MALRILSPDLILSSSTKLVSGNVTFCVFHLETWVYLLFIDLPDGWERVEDLDRGIVYYVELVYYFTNCPFPFTPGSSASIALAGLDFVFTQ